MSYLKEYDAIPPANVRARLALTTGWIRTDTRPFFAELRERRPIFSTPAYTFVTRYRDVIEVLDRDDVYTVQIYAAKMDPSVGPTMLARDRQPLNWRHKSIMRTMMPREESPRVRGIIADIAQSVLSNVKPGGRLELINDLARYVPYQVVSRYFGFPGPDQATIYRWSKATQTAFFKNLQNDPAPQQAAVAAGQEMSKYIAELIGGGAVPKDTVVGRLLNTAYPDGVGLNQQEMISNICALLVGSMETTQQAIAQALEQILLRPPVMTAAVEAARAQNYSVLAAIVWEALRFNPINPLLFRVVGTDTVLAAGTSRETRLRAGTLVFACTASAMWDGDEIENPDMFVPGRPSYHYLHFGYKAHECLGIYIGEEMVIETIRCLLLRGPRLIEGDEGKIDFKNGPFPEAFHIVLDGAAS